MVTRHVQLVTRETQEPDVIYVVEDSWAFVTPDGIGRFFYDSLEEAQEAHGEETPVVYAEEADE